MMKNKSENDLNLMIKSSKTKISIKKNKSYENIKKMKETMFSQWLIICSKNIKLEKKY